MSDETRDAIRELIRTLAEAHTSAVATTLTEAGPVVEILLGETEDYLKMAFSHLDEALARIRGQYPGEEQ